MGKMACRLGIWKNEEQIKLPYSVLQHILVEADVFQDHLYWQIQKSSSVDSNIYVNSLL